MQYDVVRMAQHLHGHLGWLSAAVLVHPAVLLRNLRRKAHGAVLTAALLPTAQGALGAWLYVSYRSRIKQSLFMDARWAGLLFERKEHLAFGAILLGWSAAAAYFVAPRTDDTTRALLRTFAFRAFVASAALTLLVASFGTIVASVRSL